MVSLQDFLPPVPGESLAEMARFYQKSLLLARAFELGIFARLAGGPKGAGQLAMEMEVRPERLVLVLDALTSLGLLEKRGERYSNSVLAATFLCPDSRFYLGNLLKLQLAPERRQQWERLGEWLRGEEIRRPGNPHEVFNPSFIHAMAQACNGSGYTRPQGIRYHSGNGSWAPRV